MIEVVHKLSIATKIGQAGCAARDLAQAVSESRINYWASYVTDLTCPFYLLISECVVSGAGRPSSSVFCLAWLYLA